MNDSLLNIESLHVMRSHVTILRDISLYINEGEIIALLGPNGAGKSTLFGSIMGIHKVTSGYIEFEGRQITGLPPRKLSEQLSFVPQESATFPYLTVLENLWIATKGKAKNELLEDDIFNVFPVLKNRIHQEACTLSGGERQMLTLGLGLARKTKLLILDEPTLGLAPLLVNRILSAVGQINQAHNLSILISEQTPRVLDNADRVYVIEGGTIRIEGKAEDLKYDVRLRKVYLGMVI